MDKSEKNNNEALMMIMLGMNMIIDDDDDDVADFFRCEQSVPNEDSRGEELRSGAKHCTHLITIARIRWDHGGSFTKSCSGAT